MRYILDFDDALFDTARFKKWLVEHKLNGPRNKALIEVLKKKIEDGELDMKEFVFKDAFDFLGRNTDRAMIVSSYISKKDQNNEASEEDAYAFQEFKLQMSGVAEMVHSRYKLVGESKSDVIKEELANHPEEEFVFVDDKKEYLREVEGLDRLHTVQIRREAEWKSETIEGKIEFGIISDFERLKDFGLEES